MNTFNSNTARNISLNKCFTSFDICKAILEFIQSPAAIDMRAKHVGQDIYAIVDNARRQGAYQVFGHELCVSLAINGFKLNVVKTPLMNVITFVMTNREGYHKYTMTNIVDLENFLLNIVNHPGTISMFEKA